MAMSNDIEKAMILAAGEGTRLRPLTLETPKVLLPIGGVPLICYTLAWLKSHGITQIAINLYHRGEKIKEFLGDGSRFGVEICYSQEENVLGTAGGVKRVEHFFDSTFVVVYGDVLTDFDLSAMINFHQEKKAVATLALFEAPNPKAAAIVQLEKQGRVINFVEKPGQADPGSLGSGGIYVLERQVLDYIPDQGFSDFAYDIFPKLVEARLPLYGYVLTPQDYLLDIGTPEKYRRANQDIERVKIGYGQKSGIFR
ncbi:nucleotidyltransferase family protein [Dehalococcoidia bacterium]|nr:nucleotidyltransferase family protein [Dehalococcoidia bacterium]